jgi:hypothetical protein
LQVLVVFGHRGLECREAFAANTIQGPPGLSHHAFEDGACLIRGGTQAQLHRGLKRAEIGDLCLELVDDLPRGFGGGA